MDGTQQSTDGTQTPDGDAQEDITLSHHTESHSGRTQSGNIYSSLIYLNAADVPVGGSDDARLRVRDESGRTVTITTDGETREVLNGIVELDIYGPGGTLLEEPVLEVADSELPVATSGDTELFSSGDPFRPYTVEAMDGSTVLDSTAPRVYGIGYESNVTVESTGGRTELRIPIPERFDDAWTVLFTSASYDENYSSIGYLEEQFEHESDQLVASFDTDSLPERPENGQRNTSLVFHVDGNTETLPNLRAGFEQALP